MIFCDPVQRTFHADWEEAGRETVALLRRAAVRYPDDTLMRELAAELGAADQQFAQWWREYDVAEKRHGAKTYVHPTLGTITLNYEALPLPDDGDQILTVYTGEALPELHDDVLAG